MFVIPEDIAVSLGRTAPDEGTPEFKQWQMWVNDAEMLIEARLGSLSELDATKLAYVVREAVVAHIRKPDDATQVSVSVDDAQSSRTYRSSKGRVTILDEWWDLLSPSTSSAGAFSISPFGTHNAHLPWCTLTMYGTYCSCGADIAGHPIYEFGDI